MSEHRARVAWSRSAPEFRYETYDRNHTITLGNGTEFSASAAAEYRGDASHTNPEELFVSALSSCHMLTFLAFAARGGHIVERYEDEAFGVLGKGPTGKTAVTLVTLRPRVAFSTPVTPEQRAHLHEQAHAYCMIANSVSCEVRVDDVT